MHDQSNIIFFVLDLLLEFVAHAMDGIENKVLTHLFLNKERVSHQQIIHCSKVILFKQFENRKKINHFKTIEGSHCSEKDLNFVISISFQQKEFSHLIFLFHFPCPLKLCCFCCWNGDSKKVHKNCESCEDRRKGTTTKNTKRWLTNIIKKVYLIISSEKRIKKIKKRNFTVFAKCETCAFPGFTTLACTVLRVFYDIIITYNAVY